MKKVLFVHHGNNPILLDDIRAVTELLGEDYEFTYKPIAKLKLAEVAELELENFAGVIFTVPYIALHASGGEALSSVKEIIRRTPEDRLFMQTADVKLVMDAKMWDKAPEGEPLQRENPYLLGKWNVIASVDPKALEDPDFQERAERLWLRFMGEGSKVISAEYTAGLIHFLPEKLKALAETVTSNDASGLFPAPEITPIERFYYGIDKPALKKSLIALGLGDSPEDAVFGNIAKLFPEVKNLSENIRKKNDVENWIPYAQAAKQNLLPYEPLKGDYQFTRRMLELAVLVPGTIVQDEQISPYVREFDNLERWKTKAEEVRKDIQRLMS